MGDHQDDTGWRPPIYFALGAVGTLAMVWAWPDWRGYCPTSEINAVCAREWLGSLSGWAAALGAIATIWMMMRTLRQMERSSENQLRAYVYEESVAIQRARHGLEIAFALKNFGSTPASQTIVTTVAAIGRDPRGVENAFQAGAEVRVVGDLAPGHTFTGTVPIEQLITGVLPEIFQSQVWVFLQITIQYQSFGKVRRLATIYKNVDGFLDNRPMLVTRDGNWVG